MNLKINNEFKNLIPPLAKDELEQLEANIKKEGCRDSLVTWQGFIIDGHNRYEICSRNGIEFSTINKEFKNREEVVEWIIRNQFGRRNLSLYDRTKLALKLEPIIKERAKERMLSTQNNNRAADQKVDQQVHGRTNKILGKIAGVSHETIHKSRVIEAKATPEQKEKLMKGEVKINKVYEEIRKTRDAEEPKRKCSICGINKIISDYYIYEPNKCKSCYGFIKTQERNGIKVDVKALKENMVDFEAMIQDLRKKPSNTESNLKIQPDGIVSQLDEILNTFHVNINKFLYMNALKEVESKKMLLDQINKAIENLNKIKQIMED